MTLASVILLISIAELLLIVAVPNWLPLLITASPPLSRKFPVKVEPVPL